jgi:hypothetical protein
METHRRTWGLDVLVGKWIDWQAVSCTFTCLQRTSYGMNPDEIMSFLVTLRLLDA